MSGLAQPVVISNGRVALDGDLRVPAQAVGLVIFAHGSGSSRFSVRNRQVAEYLNRERLATLLMDLLTSTEEAVDSRTRAYRFDIGLLGMRVCAAVDWASSAAEVRHLPVGCFGASTGAAAALRAAAARSTVSAVVSRGGRPDLAGNALPEVQAPTLLIVGGDDEPVIGMNREAMRQMRTHVELEIVPGATHLFEEPGTLERVQELAAAWFVRYLADGRSVL